MSCTSVSLSCIILIGRRTTFVARGAALRRPRTTMVTTERSAPSDWGERPSILAQLRAWSAKHPLRPEDGGPPALCGRDEIPIFWEAFADRPHLPVRVRPHREQAVDVVAAEEYVAAIGSLQAAVDAYERERGCDGTLAIGEPEIDAALAACYLASLDTRPTMFQRIIERLRTNTIKVRTVRALARWLLEQARQGETIELAVYLIVVTRHRGALDLLRLLGLHEELRRMAVPALDRLDADVVDLRWARLKGAGCSERRRLLLQMGPYLAERPDVREWIISYGWDIPDGCTGCAAAACAIAGDLAGALASPDVGDALLDGACGLVRNLFGDMGGDDIETCPDGMMILDRLIGLLLDRCDSVARLRAVQRIHDWLDWPSELVERDHRGRKSPVLDEAWKAERARVWARREALGWTEEIRADLADDCRRILRRPHWPSQVREAFAAYEPHDPDDAVRGRDGFMAWTVAPAVRVDLWEDGFALLERYPMDYSLTARLVDNDDAGRVERVIRLAERSLPRAMHEASLAVASEGGNAGAREIPLARPLTFLLQAMRRHHLFSERLVALALRQQGRLRDSAVGTIKQHLPSEWGEEVVAALRVAAAEEHSSPIRERLIGLLSLLE
jgi:hypothetical protein